MPDQLQPPINDRWVFGGLLLLLLWAPLPLGSTGVWAMGILLMAATALLCAALLAWRRQPELACARARAFRYPVGLLAAMVVLAWFQTLPLPPNWVAALSPAAAAAQGSAQTMTLSLDLYQSQLMAGLAFTYFAVFLVAVLTVRNARRLDLMAQAMVWSGVGQAVVGAVLFSLQARYSVFFVNVSHDRMMGTYAYHNSLAGYLCMCLSVGVGLMLARLGHASPAAPNWRSRVISAIEFALSARMRLRLLLVVMVIALVLTRSRMGNAAFFVAMLVVGLAGVILARKMAPQALALIVSLIVIDVMIVGTSVGLEKVIHRIQDTELTDAQGGKAESVEARTRVARTGLALVNDFPLLGSGGGSFYNVSLGYSTLDNTFTPAHTHNDYVEIACDYGLLGLGILGTLVAMTLGTVLRVMARRKSVLPWGIAFGVAMAIVGLLVHSTVDYNLQIPANALTMVVILAMGWVAKELPSRSKHKSVVQNDESDGQ